MGDSHNVHYKNMKKFAFGDLKLLHFLHNYKQVSWQMVQV